MNKMSEPTTLKRPKSGDDEEELFRMQEEFLRSNQEPSAKVINLRARANTVAAKHTKIQVDAAPTGRIRSKFAERKALEQQQRLSTSTSDGSMINPGMANNLPENNTKEVISDPVQNLPLNPSDIILGNIIEKKYNQDRNQAQFSNYSMSASEDGFPKVFLVDQKTSGSTGSLFLQQVSNNIKSKKLTNPSRERPKSQTRAENVKIEESLRREIHEANMEKIQAMSKEEILEAKSQLENTLSPELLQFLKTKKKNAAISKSDIEEKLEEKIETLRSGRIEETIKSIEETPLDVSTKMECDVDPIPENTPAKELADMATTKGWVNMDKIETEKLEWTKDVEKSENVSPDEPYNARFDFNGVLLPFRDDNLSVDKGLHHHGEEPDRPGYSLQELLQLSRSSNQQQRCAALMTLANIMEQSRKGYYDKVLEPPPLVALNEKNILLLLRFSLDDTSVAVVGWTLRALCSFLYSECDEICMDRLFEWNYRDGNVLAPELPAPKTDVSDTSNLKDHELAQLDTVAAVIRTDIVLRIRYILSEMHPPPMGVTAALQILTRLARHSRATALNIACTPRLLDIIVKNFIPLSTDRTFHKEETLNAYGVPNTSALKLCRILVSYGGIPVAVRLNDLKIVHSIMSYTTSYAASVGTHLTIEALRLWKLLLLQNLATDSISGFRLSFISQLQLILSNHDLGNCSELACEYAAALINVAIHESSLRPQISTLLTKWSTQLEKVSSLTWSQTKLVAITFTALNDMSALKCGWIKCPKTFERLCSTSNLLSDYTPSTFRDPSSLPNFGVVMNNEVPLQPSISVYSCLPFFATCINAFNENSRLDELEKCFSNNNFVKYVRRLSCEDWNLENSWFTRSELYLVTGIVRATMRLGRIIDEINRKSVLRIAIKLVSTLPSDASNAVKEILGYILSDEKLTMENLSNSLNNLKLNVRSARSKEFMNLPKDLSIVYGQYVTSSPRWEQAAMPKDWLYLPLVAAYTNHKNNHDNWNDNDTTKIIVQLSLELSMPEIVDDLSPSLRFSRLLLIYLCDTIYHNADISILSNEIMSRLLTKYHKKFDFNVDLPGLCSFTDLFTSLCECFCANSYGDDGFSMALLVPICQRHDVHYRKLLWSEHAGVLRYVRLKRECLSIPFNEYLYPIEEDPTLIESYMTSLVRGIVKKTWCPLMYDIALHHSAMFIRGNDKLAVTMRKKIVDLSDRELSRSLLNYEPPK